MLSHFFNNLSIRQRMRFLIGFVTFLVLITSAFISVAFNKIESRYKYLQENSVVAALYTLEIEKALNYVSRVNRDIMLGNDYDKNIIELQEQNQFIKENFKNNN
jgi:methyl-accepting chemotaxis protein